MFSQDFTGNKELLQIPSMLHKYIVGPTIGRGPNSVIKYCENESTGEPFALKVMSIATLQAQNKYEMVIKEIKLTSSLRHPSILKVFDWFEENELLCVVTELCKKGTLGTFIMSVGKLTETDARVLFKSIVEGIHFLHTRNLSHRDLTVDSIMITEAGEPKICNFGCCHEIIQHQFLITQTGTPIYAAPEVIRNKPYDGKKTDSWALGLILYILITGTLPWTEKNATLLLNQITAASYSIPNYASPLLVDLLSSLIVAKPSERMLPEGILGHPWFQMLPKLHKINTSKSTCSNMIANMSSQSFSRFDSEVLRQSVVIKPRYRKSTDCFQLGARKIVASP